MEALLFCLTRMSMLASFALLAFLALSLAALLFCLTRSSALASITLLAFICEPPLMLEPYAVRDRVLAVSHAVSHAAHSHHHALTPTGNGSLLSSQVRE